MSAAAPAATMDAPSQQRPAQNEWVTRVLGVAVGSPAPAGAAKSSYDPALMSKAIAAWVATLNKVNGQVDDLRFAVVDAYAARGLGPALAAAYETTVSSGIRERNAALLEVLNTVQRTEPSSPRLQVRLEAARDAVDDLQDFVNGNPVLAGLDNNPFGMSLSVRATMTGSLKAIAKILG